MPLHWLSRLASLLRGTKRITKKKKRETTPLAKIFSHPRVEELEDRTLLSSYQWIGGGTGATATNWNNSANWLFVTGSGTNNLFPQFAGDVAKFTSSTATQTTATVNVPISVGEIDFGSTQNFTITASGGNVLTLDNTAVGANAILNVGTGSFTNTGKDIISAPISENAGTPVLASIGGGTLDLTNTVATSPNAFTNADSFTVKTGGTLEFASDPTSPALGAAAIFLNGGILQIDSSASGPSTPANFITDAATASSTITTTGSNAVLLTSATSFAGSGALTVTNSGTSSLTLITLALPSPGGAFTDTLTQNASTALTVNSVTDDGLGDETLIYAGTGTVNLPNASSDSNVSVLSGATLNVGNNLSLGFGTPAQGLSGVTLTSGTIEASNPGITLSNALTFSSGGTVTLGGGTAFTLNGGILLNGNDTINVTNTDPAGTTLDTTFYGINHTLPTDTLIITGTQTLNLPAPDSTDTSKTILNGATLNVGNNASLGTGVVTLTSGTIEASTTSINIANNLTYSTGGSLTVGGTNALHLSGAVTLTGSDTLNVADADPVTGIDHPRRHRGRHPGPDRHAAAHVAQRRSQRHCPHAQRSHGQRRHQHLAGHGRRDVDQRHD